MYVAQLAFQQLIVAPKNIKEICSRTIQQVVNQESTALFPILRQVYLGQHSKASQANRFANFYRPKSSWVSKPGSLLHVLLQI